MRNILCILSLLIWQGLVFNDKLGSVTLPDLLFSGFQNPPAATRPFVRWWRNGNLLNAAEIKRELNVLHSTGIGGVKINPISLNSEADNLGEKPVEWFSREWNELLVLAAKETKQKGMLVDLLVAGWSIGDEFLKEDETIQRVIVHNIACSGGQTINEDTFERRGAYRKMEVFQAPEELYDLETTNLINVPEYKGVADSLRNECDLLIQKYSHITLTN